MKNTSRRSFIKNSALTVAGLGILQKAKAEKLFQEHNNTSNFQPADGTFKLPTLDYAYNALEPHIDAMTMEIHHSKHHQAYINKLNELIGKTPELQNKTLDTLVIDIFQAPEAAQTALRNNAGGHWNHSLFWKMLNPNAGSRPANDVFREAMMKKWNDMDSFKAEFHKSAMSVFGSGWTWLVKDGAGQLSIVNTANQDNPLMDSRTIVLKPILGIDVWEHAYYLKYQNRRAEYLDAVWNVIDWSQVSRWYVEM